MVSSQSGRKFAMASITLKNIPDDLYDLLRIQASTHHRSINSEMIHCLETVLRPSTTGVEERLARLQELRSRIQCDQFDAEEINAAIDRGRP
jgi:plasmid stability protein